MIIKAVSIFLIVILVLGMFGRLRLPNPLKRKEIKQAEKCKSCGAFLVGDNTCPCGKS